MSQFGFDKGSRLLKKVEYDFVFSQADRIGTPEFVILYRDNSLGHARLGLTLSKKVVAKAHDRNRLKRLLRETFRLNKQLPAIDLVILAKHGVAKVPSSTIVKNLSKSWNKLSTSYKK